MKLSLDNQDKKTLITVAKKSLQTYFRTGKEDPLEQYQSMDCISSILKAKYPCFVTLVTKDKRLRGCIGCMESNTSLLENIYHYARRAAFEDPRFQPVAEKELKDLS